MSSSPSQTSRVKGAIFGLAVCDALGAPVEFKKRGSFPKVTSMLPNDNFQLPAGCFTDDTSMALCLAHSLLDNNGQCKPVDQARKYINWWQDGYMSSMEYCFDIGTGTILSLQKWAQWLKADYDGLKPGSAASEDALATIQAQINHTFSQEKYCGNGSLMRVLPVALIAKSEADTVAMAGVSSTPTHPHPRCVHACQLYATLVYHALQGASKDDLAMAINKLVIDSSRKTFDPSLEPVLEDRLQGYCVVKDWAARPATQIRSSGYVVDSLEAALWAFFKSTTFEDGAVLVVNLGDDADTVGAIYGGLAGAFYGVEAIPKDWLRELMRTDLLDEVLQKILTFRAQAA